MSVNYPSDGNANSFKIEERSFWFQRRNLVIKNAVKKFLNKNENIVDLGGGNGFVSKMLQDECQMSVTLVEPGSDGVSFAKSRGVKEVVQGTIDDMRFVKDQKYSFGLFDVLEHIEDDSALIEKIKKQQVANGYIFLTVPTYSFMWSNEDTLAGHVRRYTQKEITEVFKKSGYSIVFSHYFFASLLLPIFLFRVIPYRLGVKRNQQASAQDHNSKGLISTVLELLLSFEQALRDRSIFIPFGSSLLVVASKDER